MVARHMTVWASTLLVISARRISTERGSSSDKPPSLASAPRFWGEIVERATGAPRLAAFGATKRAAALPWSWRTVWGKLGSAWLSAQGVARCASTVALPKERTRCGCCIMTTASKGICNTCQLFYKIVQKRHSSLRSGRNDSNTGTAKVRPNLLAQICPP